MARHTPPRDATITDEHRPDELDLVPAEELDLDGYQTSSRRFLERSKGILGVVLALALVIPLGAGLLQAFVFDRAGDRVVEELADDPVTASLAASVLLVGGQGCTGGAVTGTAFVLEHEGRPVLVTNRHVVDDARSVGVRDLDGGAGRAVASWAPSRSADVAVLELADPGTLPPALPSAGDDPRPGLPVRTVGFPSGLPFTTEGTVAEGAGARTLLDLEVAPGASGSPVVDADGAVVAQVYARTAGSRGVATSIGTLATALDDLEAPRSDCPGATEPRTG